MAWSSASPAAKKQGLNPQTKQMNGNASQQEEVNNMMVGQFNAQNSTIQEQPTEEQLQASGTATMINYNLNRQTMQGSASGFYMGQGLARH